MKIIFLFFVLSLTAHAKTYKSRLVNFESQVLTEVKDVIWGFDFLNPDRIIFTERGGKLKILNLSTNKITEISGVPEVFVHNQGGLLDVRIFEKNKIYFTYSEPVKKLSTTALATAEIDGDKLKNFKKVFSAAPTAKADFHYGSRIEFDHKGHLFLSVGERNERSQVQNLDSDLGKVLRFSLDRTGKREVWSYGHRNPQGLAFDPEGNLWLSEFGPKGGDEINLIEEGKNYGWPNITYGKEYSGLPIGPGEKAGVTPPIVYWVPSISPSGIAFYTGDRFPQWKNNMFVATLSGQHLRRLKIENKKVTEQEELMPGEQRFRNVRTGPDGYLYYSTDSGLLARLVPAKK